METKKLYQTSGGRILLTLKAIWQKFQKNTLWFWLLILISFLALTRISYLFTFNLDDIKYSSWMEEDFLVRLLPVSATFILIIPWAFNKFVRNSNPITFASIPANLWEKVTALFGYILIVLAGAAIATELTVIVDHLINPEYRPLGLDETSREIVQNAFSTKEATTIFCLMSSMIITGISLLIYTSILFKKALAGIGVGLIIGFTSFALFISCVENIPALQDLAKELGHYGIAYTVIGILTTIEVILIVLISCKLKRIEN